MYECEMFLHLEWVIISSMTYDLDLDIMSDNKAKVKIQVITQQNC